MPRLRRPKPLDYTLIVLGAAATSRRLGQMQRGVRTPARLGYTWAKLKDPAAQACPGQWTGGSVATPIETDVTGEEGERKGAEEWASECQRLLATKVNLSDYEVRTERVPSRRTLERVRELLWFIEEALDGGKAEDLEKLSRIIDALQGLDEDGAVIRCELEETERAIKRVAATGGKQAAPDEPIGRTEKAALRLHLSLGMCDARYTGMTPLKILEFVKQAALSDTSTGKPGRGKKGARWVLAKVMAETRAHDATSFEHAQKIVEAKKPKNGKDLRVARPRFIHSLGLTEFEGEKESGDGIPT